MSGNKFFDTTADILSVYITVIGSVKLLVEEIYHIYENAECNKEFCLIMVDRVKTEEFSMEKIIRNIEKKKEDFLDKSYYLAFERFINNLTQIKEYIKSVSKLKGYNRFLHAIDVKNKFDQLRNDFDGCMADLNFVIDDSNEIDREEEYQRVDKSLKEVKDSLEQLNDKLIEGFKQADDKLRDDFKQACDKIDAVTQYIDFMQLTKQDDEKNNINPDEFDDPKKQINRENLIKKLYKSTIEVACKPISFDSQNENQMAILRKLNLSPQILKFYGHSVVNNSQVMIIEWAELGNLREYFDEHDITWTRKIKIAKDILLGLLFLRTVNVFHYDVRCENVFVLRDLSVKLGNFKFESEGEEVYGELLSLPIMYIVRWMAPELIKKYNYQRHFYEIKRVNTFNCKMFSFGMLLWELCYEKLPYAEWNFRQISDHVLNGKRENILKGKFANPEDREIQLEFIKIIQDAWHHQPELRITIPALRQRLEDLANKFPIPLDIPPLYKNKELDIDGLKSGESILENDYPEIDEEISEEIVSAISLKDGIDMHKNKNYKSAWECFKQNVELNNPVAKFWVGYYLNYGHHGEKDPIQARKYFKEAADESNHAESQCRYAVSLLSNLGKETDKTTKGKLHKEIILYFELAANNPENRNADAMYYLGDIYVGGKLKVKKDEERGLNYLRLAANLNNERAIALLKKLDK
ncbi:kinase-like protein [Gigaspora margarita]|uniref:Kinase-like protein n=1 Tax=Gigaspora margarita TaxID=4874 RepID=A0A8H4EHQ9_GIGMA|nr:kinase-like protein [Gigaspora margarita]